MRSRVIELTVNDEPREFLAAPGTTLLSSLRDTLGVTSPKRGCAQGTCGELDEVQAAFLEGFATQCGFCTAGMIMAAEALLAENPEPTREDVVRAISGNVCRCTGYEPIIEAILDAAERRR